MSKTFKQYLLEEKQSFSITDETLKKLKQDCSKFLNEETSHALYRGTNSSFNGMRFYPQRAERTPTGTSSFANKIFSAAFDKKFGNPNLRKTSYFGTYDQDQASEYGSIKYLFPCGDYKYCSSLFISDAINYNSNETLIENISAHYQKKHIEESDNQYADPKFCKRFFVFYLGEIEACENYTNFISCVTLAARKDSTVPKDLQKFKKEVYDILIEEFGKLYFISSSLSSKSAKQLGENEIMFFEGNGHYLLNIDSVKEFLRSKNMSQTYESFISYLRNSV